MNLGQVQRAAIVIEDANTQSDERRTLRAFLFVTFE